MSGPRIGELFAGYGGLGQGVQAVLGGEIAWFSEFDKAPSKILAHHWPDVPNHGDITLIDWSTVEPVEILTGGFPCPDVSLAGARVGFTPTSRSGLWSYFAEAIGALKPRLVVIENVRGLLSAAAVGPVEPDPWGVGDGATRPVINAFGVVLRDLADLGYDAEWVGIRAADAGAPHGRFRVFILAYPQGQRQLHGNSSYIGTTGGEVNVSGDEDHAAGWASGTSEGAGTAYPSSEPGSIGHGDDVQARCGTGRHEPDARASAHANPAHLGHERGRRTRDRGSGYENSGEFAADSNSTGLALPRPGGKPSSTSGDARATALGNSVSATDPSSERLRQYPGEPSEEKARTGSGHIADGAGGSRTDTDWGPYLPAIRRWEAVTGNRAPAPTKKDGKGQNPRLSAEFVEWMMGLSPGHVTNISIGLTRNEQLKALGNGVVPQQCELALRVLLGRMTQPTMKGAA